jgi:hypothetical protein
VQVFLLQFLLLEKQLVEAGNKKGNTSIIQETGKKNRRLA